MRWRMEDGGGRSPDGMHLSPVTSPEIPVDCEPHNRTVAMRKIRKLVLAYAGTFALFVISATAQQPQFRTELFPEQLEQQQLHFKTQQIQQQIQDLQRLRQTAGPEQQVRLATQQANLLQELQKVQQEQLVLQVRLQEELARGNQPQVFTSQFPQQQQQQFQPQRPQPPPQPQQQFQPQRPQPQPQQRPQPQPQQRPQPQPQQRPQPQPQQRPQPQPPPQPPPQPATPSVQSTEPENRLDFDTAPKNIPRDLDATALPCSTSSGRAGTCRLLVRCIKFYLELAELRKQPCQLDDFGNQGVCCPVTDTQPIQPNRLNNGVLQPPPPPPVEIPPLTQTQLKSAADAGVRKVQERQQFEQQLLTLNRVLPPDSAAQRHLELFPTTNETLNTGNRALTGIEASIGLVNEFRLSPDQGRFALPRFSVLNTVIADLCPRRTQCRLGKYRLPDASCNNIQNSKWGATGAALQRILPPKYGDGVNSPRARNDGQPLPSARIVSSRLAQESDRPSENLTLLVMQWGQFLDHDLTHTPISRGRGGVGISCCQDGNIADPKVSHPDCFPIPVSRDDRQLAPFGERCMEFVRSLPAPRPECNFGPREQMNQITGFLDGSNIYGSTVEKMRQLREFRGGRLRAQRSPNRRGQPLLMANANECQDQRTGAACFLSGDGRVNEQPDLALMHTVWLREHNRVANELARLRPDWNDEALYQEAKRIVVAEMQHITYNEFLPLVLGRAYMDRSELLPKESGYTSLYDRELNPGITNAFATAAFRFGHTLLVSNLLGLGRFGDVRKSFPLSKSSFKPFMLYEEDGIDNMIRGLSIQSTQGFDRFFTKEVTNHLFQNDLPFGLDLVALNIQRGRDHGLPPYPDWRQVCGLSKPRDWSDLASIMEPDSIDILRNLYGSVDEIDLFVAGVSEKPVSGALLSPTFICLVGDQFGRLRRGDRFFYEEGNQPSSFKPDQLQQIRKTSLARILCDNSDNIGVMQPLAFFQSSFVNQRVTCNSDTIPKVDLRAWGNERPDVA